MGRAGDRMDGGEPMRQQPIAAEGEEDARGAEHVAGEVAEHRDRTDPSSSTWPPSALRQRVGSGALESARPAPSTPWAIRWIVR